MVSFRYASAEANHLLGAIPAWNAGMAFSIYCPGLFSSKASWSASTRRASK